MEHQNQILQTLRAPESQARLERIVSQESLNNRAAVGRRVCAEFGFVDARGSAQLAGCLKALNTLHKAGRIALPASRRGGGAPMPQRFDAPVAAATAVPGTVEAVAGLSLELVEQGGQRRVWNTLLHFEHPQGTTTFAGCQVRYLVVSAHGVLGAVGFSAAALQLRAREAWMGWSAEQRQAHLHRVLCLSRFLIRPGCNAATWPARCWARCWRVWRRISKPATSIVRGWWRPSSAPRMTAPASRRPTSCGSARRPVAGARTATTRGSSGQVGIYVRVGTALAAAVGGGAGRRGAGAGAG